MSSTRMIDVPPSPTTSVSAVSQTYVVTSFRSQDEILKAIGTLDRSANTLGIMLAERLSVRVSGKQFIFARNSPVVNPFARALFGVVHPASKGSVINYTFSVKPAVRIIFGMWFALMTVVLLTGISAIISGGVTNYRLELIVLAIAFLAGALGVVSLCLLLSRRGEQEMERVLLSIIGDTDPIG